MRPKRRQQDSLGKYSLVKRIKESIWFSVTDKLISGISFSILQVNIR
jgi:hypothetical protein